MVASTRMDRPSDSERRWKWGKNGRKKRVLVMKCNENDNLTYCGEYLSVFLDSAAPLP